jgi:predicted ATPase/DNA-binding winged helix-turn-helix (wHTH) protein
MPPGERYAFGPFLLDASLFQLLRDGVSVPVQPKTLELLVLLVRHRDRILSREEIERVLWPDVHVTDQSLRQLLHRLRQALDDDGDVLETVPRKGVRFVAALREEPAPEPSPSRPPFERDPFVGRQQELDELDRCLDGGARLVTVCGPGGCGKTRLVVHRWQQDEAVLWVDLSEARDLDGLVGAVGRALDVPLLQQPIERLAHVLAARGPCVVLLDNFEQLVSFAEPTLGAWLERCPQATFVVTSREVLAVRGEHVLQLGPMAPGDAQQLFSRRAAAARADFQPGEDAIPELVELLDRLPLALELAAARVRTLTPPQILARLSDRFALLTARHTTLWDTLDWSWSLLLPHEQQVLAQLSVFAGGFTLQAADGVVELPAGSPPLQDVLGALVDKSLVQPVAQDRLGLLWSVRDFARHQLETHGDAPLARDRHGRWFSRWGAQEIVDRREGPDGPQLLRTLAGELGNLKEAVQHAVRQGHGEIAALCAMGSWTVLAMTGPLSEGRALLEAALDGAGPRRALVQTALGRALRLEGKPGQARAHAEAGLKASRTAGDRRGEGQALAALGALDEAEGRVDEAREHYEQAVVRAVELHNELDEAGVQGDLGTLHWRQGRAELARSCHTRALELCHKLGLKRIASILHYNVGVREASAGRPDARVHYEAARTLAQAVGDRRALGLALTGLAQLETLQGHHDLAVQHFEAALELHRSVGHLVFEVHTRSNLGLLQLSRGQARLAREQLEASLALAARMGDRRACGDIRIKLSAVDLFEDKDEDARAQLLEAVALLRETAALRPLACALIELGRLEKDEAILAEARAGALEVADPRLEALVECVFAEVHLANGRLEPALEALDTGEALLRQHELQEQLALALCTRARLLRALGRPGEAEEAWGEASALAARLGLGPDTPLGRAITRWYNPRAW